MTSAGGVGHVRARREDATVRALRAVLNASGDPEAALLHFARSTSDQEADVLRAALAEKIRHG